MQPLTVYQVLHYKQEHHTTHRKGAYLDTRLEATTPTSCRQSQSSNEGVGVKEVFYEWKKTGWKNQAGGLIEKTEIHQKTDHLMPVLLTY